VEADNFDMIAMGRSEGPGCYCYANNVLGAVIREIAGNYPYVVIDNEAGLENLSRRIVQKVDLLVMVGDPSVNGIRTIERLYELAREMGIEYRRLAVIINRVREGGETAEMRAIMETTKADRLVLLPSDDEVAEAGEKGMSLFTLAPENRVAREIDRMLNDVIKEKKNG
jgi:CO dehydrogenase maturation factor